MCTGMPSGRMKRRIGKVRRASAVPGTFLSRDTRRCSTMRVRETANQMGCCRALRTLSRLLRTAAFKRARDIQVRSLRLSGHRTISRIRVGVGISKGGGSRIQILKAETSVLDRQECRGTCLRCRKYMHSSRGNWRR